MKHKINCKCPFCKAKRGELKGKNHPKFKEKHKCIDCGKNTCRRKSKRCWNCYIKWSQIPKNNGNFKGGKPKCKCGKPLSRYKVKQCQECYIKELNANQRGENHPNWQEGISKLPYAFEFTQELKESIRKRDNYTCQNCGMTEEEHLIVTGRVLHIHHIDYNKKNCKEDNLITLCQGCNSKVNFNRDYWYAYFKYIMEEE
jgi:5-methylcytosine-specific restriction endonuclease McrA